MTGNARLPLPNSAAFVGLVAYSVSGVFLQGFAFWLMISSFQPLSIASLPAVTGAYCLSWVIGVLVIWSPGGLGPRELALGTTLAFVLNQPIGHMHALAVAARIWATLGELLLAAIAQLLDRNRVVSPVEEPATCARSVEVV